MATTEERLGASGIRLPAPLPTAGNYVAAKRHRDLMYVSGHGPIDLDRLPGPLGDPIAPQDVPAALIRGRVGGEVSPAEAKQAARTVGLFLLATIRAELGSLDHVRSVLKLVGFVSCAPGFGGAAAVLDGCSDLLVEVFGPEIGRHARSAPGVAELPFGVPLVIELVVATDDA